MASQPATSELSPIVKTIIIAAKSSTRPSQYVNRRVNQDGHCLAAKLRPGNLHSADGWDEMLLPIIDRVRARGEAVVVRADAASPSGPNTRR
jgi:hypothetical protein